MQHACVGVSCSHAYRSFLLHLCCHLCRCCSYFNGRGLAETARYLFALAGQEYEDHRFNIARKEDGSWERPEFDAGNATRDTHTTL